MLYAIWIVGVLTAMFASVKVTKSKENLGKFDE